MSGHDEPAGGVTPEGESESKNGVENRLRVIEKEEPWHTGGEKPGTLSNPKANKGLANSS